MDIQLLETIPYWKFRLQTKMLEKKSWANAGKAGLHMAGRLAPLGAAGGAALGGIDYMTSTDLQNKSLIGSVVGGGLKGGMLAGGAGFAGGAGVKAMGPQAWIDKANLAGQLKTPSWAATAGKHLKPWVTGT